LHCQLLADSHLIHKMQFAKKIISSLGITTGKYQEVLDHIVDIAKNRQNEFICVANVHMLVETTLHDDYARVVNSSYIVTPDGVPLTWALKLRYGIDQERIDGMRLLPDLLKEAERNQLRVYFYGGTETMLEQLDQYLQLTYPNIQVAGMHSPPFRKLENNEINAVIQEINGSMAHLIFVVLGCPKQERWMFEMHNKINGVMLGIGGALPVMIGLQKRAPVWMQRNGLEWLYRLYQEPRRLFKRYFVTNSIFMLILIKEWFSRLFKRNY
jgi:N-acetylglucosaminyldiphosphoundecaprenol N-acetyl-beta-D-mannosaminyltransferase